MTTAIDFDALSDEEWRKKVASSSWVDRADAAEHWVNLSINLAKKLARDTDLRVRVKIAERVHKLPTSVIADLVSSHTPDIRIGVAAGPQPLTPEQSARLMNDPLTKVRLAFASSSRPLDETTTLKLLTSDDPDIRVRFIASGRRIPSSEQMRVAQEGTIMERHGLALIHGLAGILDDDTLLMLAMDRYEDIRKATDRLITADTLSASASHDSEAIRKAASDFVIGLAAGF